MGCRWYNRRNKNISIATISILLVLMFASLCFGQVPGTTLAPVLEGSGICKLTVTKSGACPACPCPTCFDLLSVPAGIDCEGAMIDCRLQISNVACGTSITLTAIQAELGWIPMNWTGGGCDALTIDNPCVFTITDDITIDAKCDVTA